MRIVFMGTPEFAVPTLKKLAESHHEVVAVFTQPDRPKGRGNKVVASPVKETALSYGIPVYQPQRIRKESVEDLRALRPDLCVTAAFGQILSQELLDIPVYGTINVHASLLPRHRGSAPIAWAIMQGDREAGVTTMVTFRGIDNGDTLLKASTPIGETETTGELTVRLSEIGAELLMETLRRLEEGTLERIPQNEDEMTYDPMLTREMGIVDWTMKAGSIVCRMHGLNPWPCCSAPYGGERLKLLRGRAVKGNGAPGEILTADAKAGLVIAAGEGAVEVLQLQAPGGKPMLAKDYLRGHPMQVGTVLKEEMQ